MTEPNKQDPLELDISDQMMSSLRSRHGPAPEVPVSVDRAILADAQRFLAERVSPVRRHRQWSSLRWAAIGSTVAAASLMLITLWPRLESNNGPLETAGNRTSDLNENDIDQNGRVDILDAFVMARQIQSGDSRARDVNHDGRRDQLDVDLVARNAVML